MFEGELAFNGNGHDSIVASQPELQEADDSNAYATNITGLEMVGVAPLKQ